MNIAAYELSPCIFRLVQLWQTFIKSDDGNIKDVQSGSTWDITGLCTGGELKGQQLRPMRYSNHFAFAWLSFHPESEIYGQE